MLAFIINSLVCLAYRHEYKKFMNIGDVQKVQEEKLREILDRNKSCMYLKKYGISSIEDFRTALPVTDYEDYVPYIEMAAACGKNILTTEEVILFEPTSGSVSASKLIPYTRALKKEFQNAIKPWIYDLYTHRKGMKNGKAYWSITPAAQWAQGKGNAAPVGFEGDSQYIGGLFDKLSGLIMLKPKVNAANFYEETARAFVNCKALTFISVWNPSLLILILNYIEEHYGKHSFGHLKTVSCWGDANAAAYAEKLREMLPGALIQPKGLIATEAFISLPILGENGSRLAVTSHYFEFLSQRDNRVYPAHRLEPGEKYEVIVTTSGGLYRYNMHDVIQVIDKAPHIRFIGRSGKVSDLFGEKLNEMFVADIMKAVSSEFCMLAPETDRYTLYIKSDEIPRDFETMLMRNFHYKYCRDIGQLKPMRIFKLTGNPAKEYLDECAARGQKLGNIKPPALSLSGGWHRIFMGGFV